MLSYGQIYLTWSCFWDTVPSVQYAEVCIGTSDQSESVSKYHQLCNLHAEPAQQEHARQRVSLGLRHGDMESVRQKLRHGDWESDMDTWSQQADREPDRISDMKSGSQQAVRQEPDIDINEISVPSQHKIIYKYIIFQEYIFYPNYKIMQWYSTK